MERGGKKVGIKQLWVKAKIRIKTCCKWWQNDAREEKKFMYIN